MKYLFVLLLLLAILFTGCDDQSENCYYPPKIEDLSGGNLSNRISETFLSYGFCPGVVPVLCYTDTLQPSLHVGSQADEIFERLSKTEPDFESRGLLMMVSDSPKLVQIRLGDRYKIYANLVGATSGKAYLSLQQSLDDAPIYEVLPAFLQNACIRVEELNSLSAYKKWRINEGVKVASNVMDYLATPSESLYGRWILNPLIALLSFCINIFHSMFWGLCLMIAILYGVRWGFFRVVRAWLIHPASKAYRIFCLAVDGFLKSFFSISMAAAALLLSSGRTEDLIALHALGIPFLDTLVETICNFSVPTLWTGALFVIVLGVNLLFCNPMFLDALTPSSRQRAIFHNLPELSQSILIASVDADASKIQASDTPYLDLYTEYAGKKVSIWLLVSPLVLFMFPPIISYVGIAIELTQILFFLPQLIRFVRSNRFSLEEKSNFSTKLKIIGILFTIATVVVIFVSYLFNPAPERSEIDPSTAHSIQMNMDDLVGQYALEEVSGEVKRYGSAEIKARDSQTYQMIVSHPTGLQGYELRLDTLDACFTNEHLGRGTIHYDRELNIIKITFKENGKTWTFTR